jgi:hypothetical protein
MIKIIPRRGLAGNIAQHARRLAQQHLHGHVYRLIAEMLVVEL